MADPPTATHPQAMQAWGNISKHIAVWDCALPGPFAAWLHVLDSNPALNLAQTSQTFSTTLSRCRIGTLSRPTSSSSPRSASGATWPRATGDELDIRKHCWLGFR
jgi:hypothetical protein